MTSDTMTAAIKPAISAALLATFADSIAVSPDTFGAQLDKLATALADGIGTALVPYIQTQAAVVAPDGTPLGTVV